MNKSLLKIFIVPTVAAGTLGSILFLNSNKSTKESVREQETISNQYKSPESSDLLIYSANNYFNSAPIQSSSIIGKTNTTVKPRMSPESDHDSNLGSSTTSHFKDFEPEDITKTTKQHFEFNPSKKQTIIGEKGTELTIEPNSLVQADGSKPVGKVTLDLVEVYDWCDYIKYDLPTIATNRPIISGGVIFTAAKDELGNELNLKPGEEFRAFFPLKDSTNMDVKMEDFYAERDDNGNLNWLNQEEFRAKKSLPKKNPNIYLTKRDSLKMVYKAFPRKERNLAPINIEDLDYNQHFAHKDRYVLRKIRSLNSKKYQNTYIATLPFAERIYAITKYPYANRAINLYLRNTNKKLWEVDDMVVKMYEKRILNRKKPVDENRYSFVYYKNWRIHQNTIDPVVYFRTMAAQRWGKVIPIEEPIQIIGKLPKEHRAKQKVDRMYKRNYESNLYLKTVCAESGLMRKDIYDIKKFMVEHKSIDSYIYSLGKSFKDKKFYKKAKLKGVLKTEHELKYSLDEKINKWQISNKKAYKKPFKGVYYKTKKNKIGFGLKLLSLGLANCDGFYNKQIPIASDIIIDLEAVNHKFNGKVYAIMNKRRTMLRGRKIDDNTYKLSKMPLNKTYKIVAIGKDGTEKVFSVKNARSKQMASEEIFLKYDETGPAKALLPRFGLTSN